MDSLSLIHISIISDRGTQFTSKFWKTLHAELGTRLDLSTAFPVSYTHLDVYKRQVTNRHIDLGDRSVTYRHKRNKDNES